MIKNNETLEKLINNQTFRKFIKYGIIGFTAFLVDVSTIYILREILLVHEMIAVTAGFCVGATYNFLFNKYWSFRSEHNIYKEFISFMSVALVGLTLNNIIVYFGSEKFGFNLYLCKIVAVGVVFFWNFTMNFKFTFKAGNKTSDEEKEQVI